MTTLLQILAATLLSSILSIVLAGLISFKFLDRYMSKMLCISAGLLLTVAFTHLLPEAFEIHENAVSVGWTLLVSVLFLFCLEFALSHQHHGHVNPPEHTISEYIKGSQKRSSGAGNAILIGDAFHNFTDGILIASAFMVSSGLGWVTALGIWTLKSAPLERNFRPYFHARRYRRLLPLRPSRMDGSLCICHRGSELYLHCSV